MDYSRYNHLFAIFKVKNFLYISMAVNGKHEYRQHDNCSNNKCYFLLLRQEEVAQKGNGSF